MQLDRISELQQLFIVKRTTKEFGKNDFFVRRGQKNNHVGFILKGGFRYLGYTSDGKTRLSDTVLKMISLLIMPHSKSKKELPLMFNPYGIVPFYFLETKNSKHFTKIVVLLISGVKWRKPC